MSEIDAGVVSITGIEGIFPDPQERLEFLVALSFRREALASFPLLQIWWVPAPVADQLILGVPDLDSWFQLRLHLSEIIAAPQPLLRFESAYAASGLSIDEARALANRFWDRFPAAQSAGVPPERIWIELAQPALDALGDTGLIREAGEILAGFPDLAQWLEDQLQNTEPRRQQFRSDLCEGSSFRACTWRKRAIRVRTKYKRTGCCITPPVLGEEHPTR